MPKKQTQAQFTRWMGPTLEALKDMGGSGNPREVSNWIAKNKNLQDSFLGVTLKSGSPKFHNEVQWTRQYLVWEGLIDRCLETWYMVVNT